MDNTLTSISFSIFSNRGIYALLLGSGISRNAGIPTGWDVVQDLIKKLSILRKEDCGPKPNEWFESTFSKEANYSTILGEMAKTPDERLNLLKPYFEPENEKLTPSKAHAYIAKLIKDGYIKVVITTNFDRLLENALRDEGIEPIIIKHSEDIKGALPLVHSRFTLIKVNGDYLDSRFLNTKDELSAYHDDLKIYLLNIINDFGMISCGWSAKWDIGLIKVFRESANFRFSSYWTYFGTCEAELKEIATFRKGQVIEIKSADSFFEQIHENIKALESLNDNHPLNADIAIAQIKKYIVSESYKIQLHDLLLQQTGMISNKLKDLHQSYNFTDIDHLRHLLQSYKSIMTIITPMLIHSVYWSKTLHYNLFKQVLSRLYIPEYNGLTSLRGTHNFRQFVALFAFYAIGITAVHTEKYEILIECFNLKVDKDESAYSGQIYLIDDVQPCNGVVDKEVMNEILSKNYYTPVSTYLHEYLLPFYNSLIPSNKEFERSFDIFEYLISLNYEHLCSTETFRFWAPWGEYKWRRGYGNDTISSFNAIADLQKEDWLPLKSGMFNGSYERFVEVRNNLQEFLNQVHL